MAYSASFTKEKWAEQEIGVVTELMLEGKTRKEALDTVTESNLFQLRSPVSVKNRFNMVYKRAEMFDDKIKKHFIAASDDDKKALTLYSFLKVYQLPLEFYYEVLLYKYETNEVLYTNDFFYFFEAKASISERVDTWRTVTIKRLISAMTLFFREAKILEKMNDKEFAIHPIYISNDLKAYAKEHMPLLYSFTTLERGNNE
ncbi:DUF1819 family protein [Lacicoccus qingdaonensis]|uniref:Putative inner membrane protein n=1 Tax=Lacicoccus qingdaonensis TaxID=576118 RepID=A0A1G9AZK1_9BACL|nr:DUF1819 family protein [Salinicoccus qingdaonensis]SDK32628.1 Putative inner membrane protein [Salinicoccus qingdaonensis]